VAGWKDGEEARISAQGRTAYREFCGAGADAVGGLEIRPARPEARRRRHRRARGHRGRRHLPLGRRSQSALARGHAACGETTSAALCAPHATRRSTRCGAARTTILRSANSSFRAWASTDSTLLIMSWWRLATVCNEVRRAHPGPGLSGFSGRGYPRRGSPGGRIPSFFIRE
jgi:hypothetical protein